MLAARLSHVFIFIIVLIAIPMTGTADARELIPTPAGGGDGVSQVPLLETIDEVSDLPENWRAKLQAAEDEMRDVIYDQVGGNDISVASGSTFQWCDMDVASNGDIYIAVQIDNASTGDEIRVYRSQNEGVSFAWWGILFDTDNHIHYSRPSIVIAEGSEDRCYLAYVYTTGLFNPTGTIGLVHAELTATAAAFSEDLEIMNESASDFTNPELVSDNATYSSYYLYLTAQDNDEDGADLWYARSTNQGDTFETAYEVASTNYPGAACVNPDVCWGYGGRIHLVWEYIYTSDLGEREVYYRRNPSSGGGGLAYWETAIKLSTGFDGFYYNSPQVQASLNSFDVYVISQRFTSTSPVLDITAESPCLWISDNSGTSFAANQVLANGMTYFQDFFIQDYTSELVLVSDYYNTPALQRASISTPTDWSDYQNFADRSYIMPFMGSMYVGFAMNASNNDQIVTAFSVRNIYEDNESLYFDAEWRGEEGFPNEETLLPKQLGFSPISPPALVDLDNDGDLEIVFTDQGMNIQVFHHDGQAVDGWPVNVGAVLSDGPAAIGDLNGDGEMSIIVGTNDGRVFGFDATGAPITGFPHVFTSGTPTYVSIGAMGGPYPRTIVALSGRFIQFLNHRGTSPLDTFGWGFSGYHANSPAAIGDVNGDGVSEAVVLGASDTGTGGLVFVVNLYSGQPVISRNLDSVPYDAPTLGDFDLDGDVEIMVPCSDGTMYMLSDDGSDVAGWPVVTASESPLTSAAIAQMLGNSNPEICFAAEQYTVEVYFKEGNPASNWPQHTTGGWNLMGAPIIDDVEGYSPDVIIGSRDQLAWSWDNFGGLNNGWPTELNNRVHFSPASGDLDLDGENEVVILTLSQMHILNVNHRSNTSFIGWPMYGQNHQRTGCFNCAEDLLSPVDPGHDDLVITRVSFAAPAPNPTSGPTLFSYELPVRAQVRLDMFDIRGHRVCSVIREEVPQGSHTISWDGRDQSGQVLSSGLYFARLTVRGPGLQQELSRKVNILR